jgi:DNA segregation ATPase FtsK/SpoIIIE, S-DNA-T family
MNSKQDAAGSLSVTTLTSYFPECVGPFQGIPYAPIGSLFHDICGHLLRELSSNENLWKTQKTVLRQIDHSTRAPELDKAIQPMRNFIYDHILKKNKFRKFHELDPYATLELWKALETLLVELVNIFCAAVNKGKDIEAVYLGHETSLNWPVDIDGTPFMVTGRYDLLLYDHRYDTPHLMDFKLCGVKRDLASLTQVMLYALMVNHIYGIEPGATVLNLYPQRSPITVAWEHILAFKPALTAFIGYVASREYPQKVKGPAIVPDPSAELYTRITPFETSELLDMGRKDLEIVVAKLEDFGLPVTPFELKGGPILVGPAFTILRFVPRRGVKVASIINRSADLQVALACESSPRIEQGPGYIGIEVPRADRTVIRLGDLNVQTGRPSPSSFVLGIDINGTVVWGDFSKPSTCHMLVGGQTGSGKSEFLRQLICSLATSSRPDEFKIVIVDPKMTDYQDLNGSPYLRSPVVDTMDTAVEILIGLVDEMESRYELFRIGKVKDLASFNGLGHEKTLPRIVLIFDEFADAMGDYGLKKDIDASLKRLGAKARAAGIHLIIATQSPRKDVVTGLIKANLPCAVALQVASGVESKIILDSVGAEKLLGKGDLIARFGGKRMRLQSPYADEAAVKSIMFSKISAGRPQRSS